jgi:hypothetical protein
MLYQYYGFIATKELQESGKMLRPLGREVPFRAFVSKRKSHRHSDFICQYLA